MRRSLTSFTPLIAGLLASLLFAILVVPLMAQPADNSLFSYDHSKEVTLTGTVSSVLRTPAPGMIMGSHLVLETPSGKLDASLGRWGLEGKDALNVTPGQQVEVTGVMKMIREKDVFLVRTVTVNGKTYAIRNQRGVAVSPQTRKFAAEKGETL